MKRLLVLLGLLSFFVGSVLHGEDKPGHAGDKDHVAVRPTAIKWGPAPKSLPPGSQMAVLVGDPSKPGVPYVFRAKLPDGYKVPPHWHPSDENVTVLGGTLLVGKGEKFDPSMMEELPAGSFMRMPKTMRHFAMAKGETIIQLHGVGPFEINYVNAADDPRKKEEGRQSMALAAKALSAKTLEDRQRAVLELVKIKGKEVLSHLRRLVIESQDPKVVAIAINGIVVYFDPDSLPILIDAMNHSDLEVREAAAYGVLKYLGGEKLPDGLDYDPSDPPEARQKVVRRLKEISAKKDKELKKDNTDKQKGQQPNK